MKYNSLTTTRFLYAHNFYTIMYFSQEVIHSIFCRNILNLSSLLPSGLIDCLSSFGFHDLLAVRNSLWCPSILIVSNSIIGNRVLGISSSIFFLSKLCEGVSLLLYSFHTHSSSFPFSGFLGPRISFRTKSLLVSHNSL